MYEFFKKDMKGLILPLEFKSSSEVLNVAKELKSKGFLVGAIRPPTVKVPILRVITKIDIDTNTLKKLFLEIKS